MIPIIIIAAVCLVGVIVYMQKKEDKDDLGAIDPDFKPAYDRFIVEAQKANIELPDKLITIQYGNTHGNSALTHDLLGDKPRIVVTKKFKDNPSSWVMLLIFHELGHAYFHLPHVKGHNSIMSSGSFSDLIKANPLLPSYLNEFWDFCKMAQDKKIGTFYDYENGMWDGK